jgi:hypothetical protein
LRAAAHELIEQPGMQPLLYVNVCGDCLQHAFTRNVGGLLRLA